MKKVLKKIYNMLPEGIRGTYWRVRKTAGQVLMFRVIFPSAYRYHIKNKKIKRKKAVFVEVRFSEITDSFRQTGDLTKENTERLNEVLRTFVGKFLGRQ